MRSLVVLFAGSLLFMALSGCIGDDSDENAPPAENGGGPWLTDLLECRGNYPPERETPIRCVNELVEVETQPGFHLDGWECVHRAVMGSPNNWAGLYRNSESGAYSLFYNTTARISVSGILALELNGTMEYRNWNHGHGNATMHVEGLDPGHNLTVIAFVTIYTADREELEDGMFRIDWSLHEGRPYPVRVLETPDAEYYFHHALYEGDHRLLPYSWGVGSIDVEGEDFAATLMTIDLVDARLDLEADGEGC